jgi:hypothetical protein
MATLSKGYIFGSTEQVTAAKLHSLVDDGAVTNIVNADIAAGAAIAASKLNLTTSGYMTTGGDFTITGTHTFSTAPSLAANTVDAITEIASALKSGSDATLVTGTKGTTNYIAKWNADGDLVDGYALIDDDSMATASATNVASAESTKAYVDAKALGSWSDKGTAAVSATQATTDGFLIGIVNVASSTNFGRILGYTDANANPTTLRASATCGRFEGAAGQSSINDSSSFCMPVKKGDYYKTAVSASSTATYQFYWIPLG